jgi:hypothetical protein
MTSQPFNNNSTKAEREQFVKDTFHTRTRDEAGGRFAQVNKSTVVGSDPATLYPRLPGGPWAAQPMPPEEPPLGFSVEDHDPVGQPWEVEASLDADFGWRKTIQDGVPPTTGPQPPMRCIGIGPSIAQGLERRPRLTNRIESVEQVPR